MSALTSHSVVLDKGAHPNARVFMPLRNYLEEIRAHLHPLGP